ncbi:MAG: polysaccharide deacetylase family protein, partial [Thiohalomonadales bacterium]
VSRKYRTFNTIYWSLRKMSHDLQYKTIKKILIDYNVDPFDFCRNQAMSWEMIKEISESKIGTIGAHTIKHIALSKLSEIKVREEAESSRDLITKYIGKITRHFSYPFGDVSSATTREFKIIKELNFATATTTRKGLLYPEHAQHLHALPRVSLNGCYQKQRYIKLFLSGTPFALWQKFNRVNVN